MKNRIKNKRRTHKLTYDDVVSFVDGDSMPSYIDVNSVTYMVRYCNDGSIHQYDSLDEIDWDSFDSPIRDFIVDYGNNDCWMWRNGMWKVAKSNIYRNKIGRTIRDEEQDKYEDIDYSEAERNYYYNISQNDFFQNHVVKQVDIDKIGGDLFDDADKIETAMPVTCYSSLDKNKYTLIKLDHHDNKHYFSVSLREAFNSYYSGILENNFVKIDYIKNSNKFTTYDTSRLSDLGKKDITDAIVTLSGGKALYYCENAWYAASLLRQILPAATAEVSDIRININGVYETTDTKVDIRGRKDITELIAPNATHVNCYSCTQITKLELPVATYVYCYDCPQLPVLELPEAIQVDCRDCPELVTLKLPKATVVDCIRCTQLIKLDAPVAVTVKCDGCTKLKKMVTGKKRMTTKLKTEYTKLQRQK